VLAGRRPLLRHRVGPAGRAGSRHPRSGSLDPRLLVRLARSRLYVLGVGLDVAGFVLTLAAARALPLFVVQSVVASFVAVTAILGTVFLRTPLRPPDRLGLTLVLGGLVLVALSATADHPVRVSDGVQWAMLGTVVLLVGLGILLGRLGGSLGVLVLGSVAGLAFGATSVGARMLPVGAVGADPVAWAVHIVAQPAAWGIVLAGGLGMLAYSSALQRGSVTQATAPLVVGETVAPALVGLWLFGDQSRAGWEWAAVTGFALAVAGALSLSRHGETADLLYEHGGNTLSDPLRGTDDGDPQVSPTTRRRARRAGRSARGAP
jgi:drug/metabolite transporter (DMT)-like permease